MDSKEINVVNNVNVDVENGEKDATGKKANSLQRRMASRHLQMIAIGGTIGTGLFLGTGPALQRAGPAGLLIAFTWMGTLLYSVMVALGEMTTVLPVPGAFTVHAIRFVEPSLGFAQGLIYWFSWAITFALELTATGLVIGYWNDSINIGVFIAVFWVLITVVNLCPVSFYGEVEFYSASIKVVFIVGFILFAVIADAGGTHLPYKGFYPWTSSDGGAFVPWPDVEEYSTAVFVGLWSTIIVASFSMQGAELVAIAAGEAKNPEKTVPSAIKKTAFRILLFFVLSVLFIGSIVPYSNPDLSNTSTSAAASPFVIAIKLCGVKVLPDITNAVLLTVVVSAGNSNLYSGARLLVGLANEKLIPGFFARTNKSGVPIYAVFFTTVFGFLAFLNCSESGTAAFDWFISISGLAGLIAWAVILFTYIRFFRGLKEKGISRDTLPYKAPWQPWFSYYGLFFMLIIIITQGYIPSFLPWSVLEFFINYISLIIFVVTWLGHKLWTKQWRFVRYQDMDFITGRYEADEEVIHQTRKQSWARKLSQSI